MDLEELTKGVGFILRENVSGWAQSGSGTNHVYPDHPPLDLSKSSYPRGTVDVISHSPTDSDIEKTLFVGDALVDITVYATKSIGAVQILGNCTQAVIDHWEGNNSNGNAYFTSWEFENIQNPSPIQVEETEKGFTRYNKTQELGFSHITTKT